ncbi:hypothetical protein [Bradyrhizobium sp. Arg816]|uniref:hypothetical protein n=1 Tax=Bradyrhizobium sp. Arg816 TaxID=2998491 RepID=UPI00249F6978|nr:hypothetical protein [Bradyrhizobium sp. Arg816]MDI3567259.1 hypothetical protein [Bradyrhizobium sp. Arg816]
MIALFVIASEAKQSRNASTEIALDCFVASLLAMTKERHDSAPGENRARFVSAVT